MLFDILVFDFAFRTVCLSVCLLVCLSICVRTNALKNRNSKTDRSVPGDAFGLVAENMEDLLKMPYGCGEQNMINFAPNTYLINYLKQTRRLTPAIRKKARSFMMAGKISSFVDKIIVHLFMLNCEFASSVFVC